MNQTISRSRRRRKRRLKQRARERRKRQLKRAWYGILEIIAAHPAVIAVPLIAFILIFLAQIAIYNGRLEEWEQAQTVAAQERVEQETETEETKTCAEIYGCDSLTGVYEYPWNTMSQDWGMDDVEGFYYHEISDECKAAGGQFPVIVQVYTYIVCKNYGVDYEMVFAMIEKESRCVWDAKGDNSQSVGLLQVQEKWHSERMKRLNGTDLLNPYTNILVGVDYLAEIKADLEGTVPEADLPHYMLAAYNYGRSGAQKHLWNKGVVKYGYSEEVMERAQQLKQEKERGKRSAGENKGNDKADHMDAES